MIEWEDVARGRCYASSKSMLMDLYYNRNYSITRLGELLGVSYQSVLNKMSELDLPRRERGGPNNVHSSDGLACPFCNNTNTKVESACKLTKNGNAYQRYRLCLSCEKKFKTIETVDVESTS